uniref:Amino acid transporter n=1 Tax=Scylla olivacea TaxID=85551 RepID=A0A0P4W6B9_SCYOL
MSVFCRISPVGILFLVASMMIEMEDFSVMLGQLGMYFGTVVLGIFIHGFIVLPTLYTVFTRKLPFRFLANMSQAYITAFATASRSVVARPWPRKGVVSVLLFSLC